MCYPNRLNGGECERKRCYCAHPTEEHCPRLRLLAKAGAVFPKMTPATNPSDYISTCAGGTFRFQPFACVRHLSTGCTESDCPRVPLPLGKNGMRCFISCAEGRRRPSAPTVPHPAAPTVVAAVPVRSPSGSGRQHFRNVSTAEGRSCRFRACACNGAQGAACVRI